MTHLCLQMSPKHVLLCLKTLTLTQKKPTTTKNKNTPLLAVHTSRGSVDTEEIKEFPGIEMAH